ncbi:LOW QUALITY PROTEIN: pentatricopeptide repeat-containing protein At3g22690-like [Dioscorea cayenensis subsp. rotundata]|uniref:LOW QUALITY PROTEIN: pentatricopeptide repeat-containing protein At3g22690-like n=1 Tax=Dioscorea cayennensis subsp. rotundata TaxID=55577 RepID=A0AB40CIH3_DIOCR|nr:LOW QUALITY PROTEIN: pentatricopeptide repeat-containing protein At3g22690-like [Dioscorea cayenensis subsp. rotundata]
MSVSSFPSCLASPAPPPPPPPPQHLKLASPSESLKLCTTINQIKRLHCHLIRASLIQSTPCIDSLIAAYARVSNPMSLRYAKTAFDLFLESDGKASLFSFNSLIRAYSYGSLDIAMDYYLRVLDHGLVPDRFTFPPLLAACTRSSGFGEGAQLHGFLFKMGGDGGVEGDLFVLNSLIHFYCESGDFESAQQVFDGMSERNVVSWTSLIDGYARGGDPGKAVSLFLDMEKQGEIMPNSITMACVVSACAKLGDLELGKRIHAYLVDAGIELSSGLLNTLVDMYMKCGVVEEAERLFDACLDRNIILWNTMISNYERLGMVSDAIGVFSKMLVSALKPDRVSVVAAMSAFAELGELRVGRQFHGYVLRHALDEWDAVGDSVIDMYMKCGELDAANKVFDMMPNKGVVSWNTLVGGCVRNGDLDAAWGLFNMMPHRDLVSWNTMINALAQDSQFVEAMSIFRDLQKADFKPDGVTMVAVASACGYLGALDLAKWIYKFINKNKISCDVKLGTAMVDMFAKCGDTKNAMRIFDEMKIKDVSSWTAAIGAMAIEGNGKRALELFKEMIGHGLRPDGVVFVGVLTACSHSGMVEDGKWFFQSMSEVYAFAPQTIHYGCMVDMFGRAGFLKEARALIESMPMEANDVIWRALLSASRVHHNIEMAEYAAKQLSTSAPEQTGAHVLLSNAYASVERWQDVAKVRMFLKEKGFQKKPTGSSLIQVHGIIHEFTSSDESHPQMAQITEMLQEMDQKLMIAGYMPNIKNVLLDVCDDEKQHLLRRHSEKMAVAYGLIGTCQGAPIRIVKNLRICLDCHSFMKFLSAIYDREIAIRDNNRFHFFSKGMCSCRDYW